MCLGLTNAIDNPTRQSFVVEMVGESELKNAVTLFSSLVNLSRIIGPLIAGALITTIGLAPCFFVNGLSYLAVVAMLLIMRASELHPAVRLANARGQIVAGLRYVWSTPVLRDVLVIMAIIGTLTYEFQVTLPLIAQNTFHGNAASYAALSAALGVGAVVGGLITASRKKTSFQAVVQAALLFGAAVLAASLMPTLRLAVAALVVVGFCSITFSAMGNTTLQLTSTPQMRGRVMSLWGIAFLGSTTIGGPIIGFIGQNVGPQWALAAVAWLRLPLEPTVCWRCADGPSRRRTRLRPERRCGPNRPNRRLTIPAQPAAIPNPRFWAVFNASGPDRTFVTRTV